MIQLGKPTVVIRHRRYPEEKKNKLLRHQVLLETTYLSIISYYNGLLRATLTHVSLRNTKFEVFILK